MKRRNNRDRGDQNRGQEQSGQHQRGQRHFSAEEQAYERNRPGTSGYRQHEESVRDESQFQNRGYSQSGGYDRGQSQPQYGGGDSNYGGGYSSGDQDYRGGYSGDNRNYGGGYTGENRDYRGSYGGGEQNFGGGRNYGGQQGYAGGPQYGGAQGYGGGSGYRGDQRQQNYGGHESDSARGDYEGGWANSGGQRGGYQGEREFTGRESYGTGQHGSGTPGWSRTPATSWGSSAEAYGEYGHSGRDYGYASNSSRSQQGYGQYSGSGGESRFSGQRSIGNRGPKGYTRSDERIREDLCDRLMQVDHIDASDVEIQVRNGEVSLTGTVSNRNEKFQVENLADSIPGVKDVNNQIRVNRGLTSDESGTRNSMQGSQSSNSASGEDSTKSGRKSMVNA